MRSGKTALATGIGTELGFNQVKIRYSDLFDFIHSTNEPKSQKVHLAYILWYWKDTDVLIFDDASVDLLSKFKNDIYSDVIDIMKTKKMIWVIEENTDNFQELVQDVFGDDDIKIIKLQ
jgi:DNA replication protein DnaC